MNKIDLKITPKRFQAAHEAGHATIAKHFNFEINHVVIRENLDLPSHLSPHVSLAKPTEANTEFFAGGVAGVIFADFPNLSRELFNQITLSNPHFVWYTKGFDEDVKSFKNKMREQRLTIHTNIRLMRPRSIFFSMDQTFVPNTFVEKIYESYLIIREEGTTFRRFNNGLMCFDFLGVRAAHYISQGQEFNIEENRKDLSLFLERVRQALLII